MATTSTGVKKEEDKKKTAAPDLTTEEVRQVSMILKKAQAARNSREQAHREFDGMTYMQDYQFNLDAANTYLQPKKNHDDVRVNTATTEKKLEAMMNELLAMNIQHEVLAFDRFDKELVGLGKDFEHIVTRTNQIEREEDMWVDMIRELISQRAVFVKEVFEEKRVRGHVIRMARKVLVPGRKVYLGDLNIPAYRFNEQPYVIEYDRMNYDVASTYFGHLDNWNKVKAGGAGLLSDFREDNFYIWRMHDVEDNEVEIIRYYDAINREYQIVINGIPMLDVSADLPWDHDGYNIVMVAIKPIQTDFAYGKPPVASAKTLQALENETIRNMIRKFRQALEPPVGVKTKTILSRDIWNPSAMTQGLDKSMIDKLIDHDGVTQSEFAMFNLISQKTEEFIGVSNLFQGLSGPGEKTATQTIEELRQAVKMLGLAVLAVMRMRRDLTYLRIYTVLREYTKPVGKRLLPGSETIAERYMSFTLPNADLEDGRRGKKIIQFMDRNLAPEEEQAIFDMEEQEATRGNLVRFRTVNAKAIRQFPIFWYVTAQQKEREGSALQKVLFREQISQAAEIQAASGGQVQVDWQTAADNMELTWRAPNLFKKTALMPSVQRGVDPAVADEAQNLLGDIESLRGQTGIGAQLGEVAQRAGRQPSMNQIVEAA